MPIQNRDYLLRLIEQLGAALGRLTGQLRGDSADDLTDDLDAELNEIALKAGLDLDLASRLSTESLSILIAPGDDVDPTRCWLLAELLYLRGLQHEREGNEPAARAAYTRSLHLYGLVRPEWNVEIPLSEPRSRITSLEERLSRGGNTE